MIIDIHSHIGKSRDGAEGKFEVLLANMEELGIVKTALFATDEERCGETFENVNKNIISLQDQYPDRIIAFARIVPSAGGAVDEFNRCIRLGIKGLKLKPADGFKPDEAAVIFDLINKPAHFPILIHTAHQADSQPQLWESVFKEYPKLNFILAHGGKDLYKSCGELVKKNANVYVDTTTLSYNRSRHLYEVLGPEKILFASDYPYSHPAVELKKFEVLVKDKKALELILYRNALQLLGL